MKPVSFIISTLCTFILIAVSAPLRAQDGKEKDQPHLRGDLEVLFQAQHRADEKAWAFAYPLYGRFGVLYPGEGFEAAVSVDLIEEVSLGETYIRGGEDYSYLKLGYFTETWRTGSSWSVIDVLNRRDGRYPNNVFYKNVLRPNPMILVSFGGGGWAQQIVVSQKEESERVNDALLGARSLLFRDGGVEFGLGVAGRAGHPPPLLFLTLKNEAARTETWAEVAWWMYGGAPDTVNGVLGAKQGFASAIVRGEFIVDESTLILFLEELTELNPLVSFGFQSYLYFNNFSAALKPFVSTDLGELVVVEAGTLLFFGEEGTYFSRYSELEDNDNQFYLRLALEF
jgi:hypothetical protein